MTRGKAFSSGGYLPRFYEGVEVGPWSPKHTLSYVGDGVVDSVALQPRYADVSNERLRHVKHTLGTKEAHQWDSDAQYQGDTKWKLHKQGHHTSMGKPCEAQPCTRTAPAREPRETKVQDHAL